MSTRTGSSFYDDMWDEFLVVAKDFVDDVVDWMQGLSDLEQLMGLCIFILILFLLTLSNSANRDKDPGRARSFVGAFMLVVTFSFVAGLMIDTPYDPRNFL
ncbi:MAG: hypothetical protein KDA53_01465 [Hyphomonas sp.]|nr:hypothetical protein [Hyphomonas sp.]